MALDFWTFGKGDRVILLLSLIRSSVKLNPEVAPGVRCDPVSNQR